MNETLKSVMIYTSVNHVLDLVLLDKESESFIDDLNSSSSIDIKWDGDDMIHDIVDDRTNLISIRQIDYFLN